MGLVNRVRTVVDRPTAVIRARMLVSGLSRANSTSAYTSVLACPFRRKKEGLDKMTTNGENNGTWQESRTGTAAQGGVEDQGQGENGSLCTRTVNRGPEEGTQGFEKRVDSVAEEAKTGLEESNRGNSKPHRRANSKRLRKRSGPVHASGKELSLCYPFHPSEVYPLVSELNAFLGEHEAKYKKSAHKKGIQVFASLRTMCKGLGIANSGKNRQLIVRAKRLLRHLGLCIFKKVYQIGLNLADLFFLTSAFNFRKSKILKERLYQERREKTTPTPPPQKPVFEVVVCSSFVNGYPASWDLVTA